MLMWGCSVEAAVDTRGPVLLQVISHIVFLQRKNYMEPTHIVVNKSVQAVLSDYISTGKPLEKLFGVEVVTNESETAVPFVVVLVNKPLRKP
jgi:hypothetical protein